MQCRRWVQDQLLSPDLHCAREALDTRTTRRSCCTPSNVVRVPVSPGAAGRTTKRSDWASLPRMHDNHAIFPILPGKKPDAAERRIVESATAPWVECWEFVTTHQLTEREGAAFWTAANLVYEAMGGGRERP